MGELENEIAAGDARLARGDLDGAELCYRKAYAIDIRSSNALHSIGLVHLHRGNFQTALTWAQKALEADPDYALAYNLLGGALLGQKRYDEALPALAKSPKEGARFPVMIQYQMALCHTGLGRWREAEHTLRAALEDDPTYATRFAAVGMIAHEPLYADCHLLLAWVLQRQGNLHEARLHDRLARRMDPTVALTPLAKEILGMGRTGPGGALEKRNEVHDQPSAHARSGPSLFVEALERKAAVFRDAEVGAIFHAGQSPPHPSAADEFDRGCLDFCQQQYAESLRIFSVLGERVSGQAALHYAVGVAYLMVGRLEDAIRALNEARHLAPADRDVHVALTYARFCATGEIASDESEKDI